MKKIVSFVGILFAGYMIGIMTYASGDKIIGSTVSANGKYKLIYTAIRYGGYSLHIIVTMLKYGNRTEKE
ncbi:MAG: hypothetical protein H7A34_08745 [bacterium]|nr:hypothetical protein [bacterium]